VGFEKVSVGFIYKGFVIWRKGFLRINSIPRHDYDFAKVEQLQVNYNNGVTLLSRD